MVQMGEKISVWLKRDSCGVFCKGIIELWVPHLVFPIYRTSSCFCKKQKSSSKPMLDRITSTFFFASSAVSASAFGYTAAFWKAVSLLSMMYKAKEESRNLPTSRLSLLPGLTEFREQPYITLSYEPPVLPHRSGSWKLIRRPRRGAALIVHLHHQFSLFVIWDVEISHTGGRHRGAAAARPLPGLRHSGPGRLPRRLPGGGGHPAVPAERSVPSDVSLMIS